MTGMRHDKQAIRLKAMLRALPHRREPYPALIAMTDEARFPDPLQALLKLPRGRRHGIRLIWRLYHQSPVREKLDGVARSAQSRGIDMSIATGAPLKHVSPVYANGLHRSERSLRLSTDRSGKKPNSRYLIFLTAAAHNERAIIRAARAGIHAVLISPVFPTKSHMDSHALGIIRFAYLARLAQKKGMAVYALGGITDPATIRRLHGTGLTGIAGISFLLDSLADS